MRTLLLLLLALGGCASAVPHPAADSAQAGIPLGYRPLAEIAPPVPAAQPDDWRATNDAMHTDGGHAGHKH
jgi:hypothetical protein